VFWCFGAFVARKTKKLPTKLQITIFHKNNACYFNINFLNNPFQNTDELVFDFRQINRFALLCLAFVLVFFYLPFSLVYTWDITKTGSLELLKDLIFWIIPIIICHEGLHGLTWALLIPRGFRQIKFGFNREMFSPYTHCKIPISKKIYISGGLAPLVLMGIIPAFYSVIAGNAYWFTLSLLCIWTSSGDILSCYALLKISNKYKIQDHPEKLGFILIKQVSD
jgi:hypothetical protein